MACGPPPRMKGKRLTEGMCVFENRNREGKWPSLLMVETTPLAKWSGRRRTNLRLVLSSPRDKMTLNVGLTSKGGAILEVQVENCAGIDVGKKFLAVCVLIGPANRKPVAEVRRFGDSAQV
jgi:hypothetical protein